LSDELGRVGLAIAPATSMVTPLRQLVVMRPGVPAEITLSIAA